MLKLTLPAQEFWDENKERFVSVPELTISMEHSLVSISKWEAKYHKPFISRVPKTTEETWDYIWFMITTQNLKRDVLDRFTQEHIDMINAYIDDPMTATVIHDRSGRRSNEFVTSELIYYWMIAHNIPVEFQKWHLNRLLTLIQVCNVKNAPPKKMSKEAILRQNAAINAARRARTGSKG